MGVRIDDVQPPIEETHPDISVHAVPAEERLASLLYRGPYRGVVSGVLSLLRWVGIRGCTIRGPLRELHLSGPAHQDGKVQDTALLELQIPVQE
jgi:effector-binding domain-containing protein